jgi:hypothetical protein
MTEQELGNHKVIPYHRIPNNPMRVVLFAAVVYLFLDRYHAPDWLYGALGAFFAILWVVAFFMARKQVECDIEFKEDESHQKGYRSWYQRGRMSS